MRAVFFYVKTHGPRLPLPIALVPHRAGTGIIIIDLVKQTLILLDKFVSTYQNL